MSRREWLFLLVPLLVGVIGGAVFLLAGREDSEADPVDVSATGFVAADLAELVAASDAVVMAEVVSVSDGRALSDPGDPRAGVRTQLTELAVVDVLAGDTAPTLLVEEESELLDGTPITVNGMAPTEPGRRGVFFLVAGSQPDFPHYALLNHQARYLVDGDDLEASSDDPLALEIAAAGGAELRRSVSRLAAVP